jgi:hypothetical protein
MCEFREKILSGGNTRTILKLRSSSTREGLSELLDTLIASWRRRKTRVTEHSGENFYKKCKECTSELEEFNTQKNTRLRSALGQHLDRC